MRYSIVYSSKTGNTRLLADALHEYLEKTECDYFGTRVYEKKSVN